MISLPHITPDWPAPQNVRAAVTTRVGGVSVGCYSSLNLGSHVGDDPAAVAENRRRVERALKLPRTPTWLDQVHGTNVVEAGEYEEPPTGDASFGTRPGVVCAVLTADCLPVLLCDDQGGGVAAAHAGWRGLGEGVLSETVQTLGFAPERLLAWLGPAIEPSAFEVGDEVREHFVNRDPRFAEAFERNMRRRWQADIYALARVELRRLGVERIYGGGFECFADHERFFSYRRDKQTGRMATMIWLSQ